MKITNKTKFYGFFIFLSLLLVRSSQFETLPFEITESFLQANLPAHIDTRSPFQKINSLGENLKTTNLLNPINSGIQFLNILNKESSNNHFEKNMEELRKFNRPSIGVVGSKEDPLSYSEYQKYFLGTLY